VKNFLDEAPSADDAQEETESEYGQLEGITRMMCWMEASDLDEQIMSQLPKVCAEIKKLLSGVPLKDLSGLPCSEYGSQLVDKLIRSMEFGTATEFSEALVALIATQRRLVDFTRTAVVALDSSANEQQPTSEQEKGAALKQNVISALQNCYGIESSVATLVVKHSKELFKEPILKLISSLPQQLDVMNLITRVPDLLENPTDSI
jgi:hypothetical protein